MEKYLLNLLRIYKIHQSRKGIDQQMCVQDLFEEVLLAKSKWLWGEQK